MERTYSDSFYAALAAVQFGPSEPPWDILNEAQWALVAAWGRSGCGPRMIPTRETLSLEQLQPWMSNLMVVDGSGHDWRTIAIGSLAAWLLREEGKRVAGNQPPEEIQRTIQLSAQNARPAFQRLAWGRWTAVGTNVLLLPMGGASVDRMLIAAYGDLPAYPELV